eukprot:3651114-Amphidinium_carterae.1
MGSFLGLESTAPPQLPFSVASSLLCKAEAFNFESNPNPRAQGAYLCDIPQVLEFLRWLEETECENYVLVVGWREAQPCLRTLQQTCHFPLMVIIIC